MRVCYAMHTHMIYIHAYDIHGMHTLGAGTGARTIAFASGRSCAWGGRVAHVRPFVHLVSLSSNYLSMCGKLCALDSVRSDPTGDGDCARPSLRDAVVKLN